MWLGYTPRSDWCGARDATQASHVCHSGFTRLGQISEGRDASIWKQASDKDSLLTMPSIDAVWVRIEAHAGETFHLVRGGAFTYRVSGGHVVPDRTPQQIPRSQFAKALELVPLGGPGEIQHLRGPSFVFAILADPRVSAGEW